MIKKKNRKNIFTFFKTPSIMSTVLYANDQAGIVSDACSICWDAKPKTELSEQLDYIQKRIKLGHESILEHSNIIMMVSIYKDPSKNAKNYRDDLLEFLSCTKYLNVKILNGTFYTYLLIGGSIRGYKHIFRTIHNLNNCVLNEVKECLYDISYSEFFDDFINDEIMDKKKFANRSAEERHYSELNVYDKLDIINIDPITSIYNSIQELVEDDTVITIEDLLDVCSITILFKDMSRTATHQLVRHRNGITQESQRYVNYSNAKFVSPENFNPAYLDKKYHINIAGTELDITMSDLGNEINKIYEQLISQSVQRQDARAFLASNTACNKLYMTFTFRNLIKFLELRTDKAAQGEIREYATTIESIFVKYLISNRVLSAKEATDDTIYNYLLPYYKFKEIKDDDYSNIDEIIEEA